MATKKHQTETYSMDQSYWFNGSVIEYCYVCGETELKGKLSSTCSGRDKGFQEVVRVFAD